VIHRLVLVLALLLPLASAGAQDLACDGGDLEIRGVAFTGNTHFRDSELGNAIITTPSSWMRRTLGIPLGARHCLDSLEVQRDAVRLRLFYRQRGYYKTSVAPHIATVTPGGVQVTFAIGEGPPVMLDSVVVTGLDSLPPSVQERTMRYFTSFRHGIYDKLRLQAAIDSAVDRLQNSGHAYAGEPLKDIVVDTTSDRASAELTFLPGKAARIGRIAFDVEPNHPGGQPQIDSSTVRQLLSFKEGDVYRRRDLLRTQRDLYGMETYRRVNVELLPDTLQPSDTALGIAVRLGEGTMRSTRVGAGWATLDCARMQARYTDRDFLGGARRLEVTARLSHITLCPGDVRRDTAFSARLNYFASATLRLPTLFGPRYIPSITLFSERTSEYRTYIRYTPIGGAIQVTRDLQPRDLRAGLPLTLGYQVEYGRTEAGQAVFCQLFNRCEADLIKRLQQNSSLQVVSATLVRDRTNNPVEPSRGSQARLDLRTGFTAVDTGAATHFNRVFAEISAYQGIGRGTVLAARLQAGTVLEGWSLAGAESFVPPQERLYAGGPNSVRGYSQNLLGPVVYIVDPSSVRTEVVGGDSIHWVKKDSADVQIYSPTGGNSLVVGNLELRTPAPFLSDVLQFVAFADAGIVWNRPKQPFRLGDVRVTPGVGMRVKSPVGPFRVDVAYNRYQFPEGAAYVVDSESRNLYCVLSSSQPPDSPLAAGESCPTTFSRPQGNSFFSRLTFNFSLGQAF
jgi:outer membrane protein insertion porin family/translocation and assembly module TamA